MQTVVQLKIYVSNIENVIIFLGVITVSITF